MTPGQSMMGLQYDAASQLLHIAYTPQTNRTLYDICDVNGTVLRTGLIESEATSVPLSGAKDGYYIVLVLDGDRVWTDKLRITR